jgi:hydroxymethylbilane synthase
VVDAAVLAAAGLIRVGRGSEIRDYFEFDQMLPAPGQGALAIEIRADDDRLRVLLRPLHCATAAACVEAERAFMRQLGGGCQLPVAALASLSAGTLHLRGRVLALDGSRDVSGSDSGPADRASEVGQRLADALLRQGAETLIRETEAHLRQEQ